MILLGIDTATRVSSVAVVREDGHVLAEATGDARGRGTDLLVLIDRACADAKISPRELDAVAIGAGPGSFTSLRIGMATAKGIAFAAGKPLWAVSSLAALAAEAPAVGDELVAAVLDARRGEVYAGVFGANGIVGQERVLPPDQLGSLGATRFIGDAGAAYPALVALPGAWDRTPTGAAVAQLALAGSRSDVLVTGVPAYIRPAEAEILYPDGVPGALRKRP
ncbi:MAG TPA: tRNA (adenosine(37)-N6)-threonylcarbamoyltransferase complex dimerization subunit type 1 TsaB [Kofleriaceae bacterium]